MSFKTSRIIKSVNNAARKIPILHGIISSGNSKQVNIQNNVDSEIRDLKIVAPYGITSCPPDGLFAQMIINDSVTDNNNVCVGVHDPSAPSAETGEIVIYSSHSDTYIRIKKDGTITIKASRVDIDITDGVYINGSRVKTEV